MQVCKKYLNIALVNPFLKYSESISKTNHNVVGSFTALNDCAVAPLTTREPSAERMKAKSHFTNVKGDRQYSFCMFVFADTSDSCRLER